MKNKYFTAIFTLCLAVTITMIPVRASEVPQGEATEAVAAAEAEEVTASVGDEITSKDHEERPESKESSAEDAQSENSSDSVNEPGETSQEEATPAEGTGQEEVTPTEGNEQEEVTPAEGTAQEEVTPAEGTGQEEVTPTEGNEQEEVIPAEGTEQEEVTPAEGTAQEEVTPVEGTEQEEVTPAEGTEQEEVTPEEGTEQEEVTPAEEAVQEDTPVEGEAPKDENAAEVSTLDAGTAAETGILENTESKKAAEQAESKSEANKTPAKINASAGTAPVATGDTLKKQAAASAKIKQMKLEVIDFKGKGYGDSQMLTSGGKRLLIDTYVKESWDSLNDWLKEHGYFNFDIFISHYHDDHMGNITNILNDGKYKVSNLYLPNFSYMNGPSDYMQEYIEWCKRIINNAKEKGVKITYLNKGSSFNVGDVNATVLWGAQYKSSEHMRTYINNNSLVTRFTCGNTRYLNAGDIEADTEKQLLNAKVDVKADIFKMSHHGINDTNSGAFLRAVGASFYYFNGCEDSPSKYATADIFYPAPRRANKYGNVASVRYNGDITYTVYNDIISQELKRNYTEQKVYLYDKNDKKKLKGVVTQQLNNAAAKRIDDRAYDGYSSAASKRKGTYAEDGWILGNQGKQYYYKNNAPLTGWKKIDGSLYHFNTKTAKKDTGWKKFGRYTFHFDGAGRAQTGTVKIGKSLFHFDERGCLVKAGWSETNGRRCYVNPKTGTVLTGLKRVGGKLYFFNTDGYLLNRTGFIKLGRKVFYKQKDGSMKTGWLKVNGQMYFMNADGTRHTGWLKRGNKKFYFDSNGVMTAKQGFVKIGNKVYYVRSDGSMKTGWLKVSGKFYYMDADGSRHTGWLEKGQRKFYFGSDGVLRAS